MLRLIVIAIVIINIQSCGGGIVSDAPPDYDSLIESGWIYYNQRKYDDAYKLFFQAKKEESERPEAYIGCGWTLLRLQHPDSAIVVFRTGFDYIATLDDSVDAISGLTGSYLAHGDNMKIINLFKTHTVSSYEDAFPLKKHDFFLDAEHLEIVQAMAFYRLGLYSSEENADPDNAVYHFNRALLIPYEYTDSQSLIQKMIEYLNQSKGECF